MAFLQWALPQYGLRWQGFRKVRRQVCRRVRRRMLQLGLDDVAAYRARLEAEPAERVAFDECCHVTISRFFRDRGVFDVVRTRLLPAIAARARREDRAARVWSAGCASGEEPYTVKILWDFEVARSCPGVPLSIVATDVDRTMLARAREGSFGATSLRELPPLLIDSAFDRIGPLFRLKPKHREGIEFLHEDLRSQAPDLRFDLILCRYLAFTYFSLPVQQQVLARTAERLVANGYLVIGTHERLPDCGPTLIPLASAPQIFEKTTAHDR